MMTNHAGNDSGPKRGIASPGIQGAVISFRNATPADAVTIQRIAYQTWPNAYGEILSAAQLDYMLKKLYSVEELLRLMSSDHQFIIAENSSGEAIAFAAHSRHPGDPTTFHLHKIYVLPQFQNIHCGKKLLEHVIEEIKSLGGARLHLNVNRHNKARYFYEKLGFEILHKEDIDIGSGYFMNDYVMGKSLY